MVWQLPPLQQPGVAHSHPSVSGAVALLQSEAPALQVYVQVVPLQAGDASVPFVAVHTAPHALQLLAVLSAVHVVPPHVVSWQVHAPLWQSGVGWAHGVWFCQLPALLQVCGMLPLQLVSPGEQTPLHTPATHVWFRHGTGLPQVPVRVQVSTPLPTHWVDEGVHATQVLDRHAGVAPEHAVVVCQVPVLSHVWMALPRHRVWPCTHVPAQAP